MNIRKKLVILTIGIALTFILISGVWFLLVGMKYASWTKVMNEVDDAGRTIYEKEYEGYYLRVKPAGFLSFESGFMLISKDEIMEVAFDEDGNPISGDECYMQLYIWPELKGNYSVGLLIHKGEMMYQLMLDEELMVTNYDEGYEEYDNVQGMVDTNRELIYDMIDVGEDVWEIDVWQ